MTTKNKCELRASIVDDLSELIQIELAEQRSEETAPVYGVAQSSDLIADRKKAVEELRAIRKAVEDLRL